MANEVLKKVGTTKVWDGAVTDYEISLESLATTKARQGEKGDLGIKWAEEHTVEFVMETGASAPTAGGSYELWWAASVSDVAGTKNPGGCSGTDSAYKDGLEDKWKVQLDYIGRLIVTNDASTIMRTYFKNVRFRTRYGMPVVVNKTDQTSETDHNEHYIALHPTIDEIQ